MEFIFKPCIIIIVIYIRKKSSKLSNLMNESSNHFLKPLLLEIIGRKFSVKILTPNSSSQMKAVYCHYLALARSIQKHATDEHNISRATWTDVAQSPIAHQINDLHRFLGLSNDGVLDGNVFFSVTMKFSLLCLHLQGAGGFGIEWGGILGQIYPVAFSVIIWHLIPIVFHCHFAGHLDWH